MPLHVSVQCAEFWNEQLMAPCLSKFTLFIGYCIIKILKTGSDKKNPYLVVVLICDMRFVPKTLVNFFNAPQLLPNFSRSNFYLFENYLFSSYKRLIKFQIAFNSLWYFVDLSDIFWFFAMNIFFVFCFGMFF